MDQSGFPAVSHKVDIEVGIIDAGTKYLLVDTASPNNMLKSA